MIRLFNSNPKLPGLKNDHKDANYVARSFNSYFFLSLLTLSNQPVRDQFLKGNLLRLNLYISTPAHWPFLLVPGGLSSSF